MASAKDQMKIIDAEIERIRAEIQRLQAQEEVLVNLRRKASGESVTQPMPQAGVRKRAVSVKPLVLDIMRDVGVKGATTATVDEVVRSKIPNVAKDTVGSILSRLKADGALVYDGERYFDKQFAPKVQGPFEVGLRAVS